MDEVIRLLKEIFEEEILIQGVFSDLRKKDNDYKKVNIKPVLIKNRYHIHFTYEYDTKVIHKNLDIYDSVEEIKYLLANIFKQGNIYSEEADLQILISKKFKVNILKKKPSKKSGDLSHNKRKAYILKEGEKIDFLIRLGVMNKEGKVVAKKYDKFKQINRFLELVEDVVDKLDKTKKINIIDFGCGKAYLTFALYHYLVNVLELNIDIIGLDLKKDVIDFCNLVAEDLNYSNLTFIHGDIKDFQSLDKVDMVVTLHACDNATDGALAKSVKWDADVILSVPCCQHEFFNKIDNSTLNPMLKHGIVKEKLSSLVTDSLRANILELLGYQVQLVEFIDIEHTPKNILIRGVKTNKKANLKEIKAYEEFKSFWSLDDLYIEKELANELKKILEYKE